MSWVDRDLQKRILKTLMDYYSQPIPHTSLAHSMFPDYKFDFSYKGMNQRLAQALGMSPPTNDHDGDGFSLKFTRNILYLGEHGLIHIKDDSPIGVVMLTVQITNKGIDFLEQDGGLSAILGVVTVKLHSDTLQAILAARIDQADISETEKGSLKAALATVKEAGLAKITEMALENAPWTSIVAALAKATGLA